jgi:hypothetical protein
MINVMEKKMAKYNLEAFAGAAADQDTLKAVARNTPGIEIVKGVSEPGKLPVLADDATAQSFADSHQAFILTPVK